MTRARFLVALTQRKEEMPALRGRIHQSLKGDTTLKSCLSNDRLLILATAGSRLTDNGALIGTWFTHGKPGNSPSLPPSDQQAAVGMQGAWLINACWGDYVAVIAEPARLSVDIIRAPLGGLACYIVQDEGALLCASDVALLRATGRFAPRLDPAAIVRHLLADDIRRSETCLVGLTELPGGHRLSADERGRTITPLWSPWTPAREPRQIADRDEAVRRVRDTASHCVAARSSSNEPVLLKLSGGLDSSIVAACLARANRAFSCLTLVTQDPAGDERLYARMVADACGAPLIERFRDPLHVDVTRSEAARLPRPTARSFTQESTRLAWEAAHSIGASIVVDGGGGDNVFCSLQSARPAADCLLSEAGRGQFWSTARSIAWLSQATLPRVAWRAWAMKRRGRNQYRWPADRRFLSPAAIEASSGPVAHPWLQAPPDILPGKAAHVALIAAAQSVAEGFDAQAALDASSPLISQPLVETCLQVPSWMWFANGLNRAVARDAFADLLPPAVVERRSKGAPDSFVAEIYEANRPKIREMLMDGWLRRQHLLDLHALAAHLDDNAPVRGHDFLRIMQLVDVEAWTQGWT